MQKWYNIHTTVIKWEVNMRQNNHRLLQLKDLLFEETDEEHELDVYEIREKLMNLLDVDKIDIRTIKNDIDSLQSMDFDIVQNRRKFGKIYYSHQTKLFETYQIRLLVDAILSARSITPNEKQRLIDKLKQLTSKRIQRTLPSPVMFSQTVNLEHEQMKVDIDRIHRAISESKVLQYNYGDYNVNKEFTLRHHGKTYYVEPYALIWQNDLYYLIAKYQETNEMRHYRLDRMRHTKITNELFVKDRTFNIQSYIDESFQMFSGEDIRITLRLQNKLLNPMFDRFGLEVDVKPDGEDHFILSTRAKASAGLLGWILQWGHAAEVLSPSSLVEEVKTEIEKMFDTYEVRG